MRLSTFILDNIESILVDWENFASKIFPTTRKENSKKLRDHAKKILIEIAEDINHFQSKSDQIAKSQGLQEQDNDKNTAAELHGSGRMEDGFSIIEMVSEYRALRATVTRLFQEARKTHIEHNDYDLRDLIRLNEGMDKALAESVASYAYATEQQNRLFETMLSSLPDMSYILSLEGKFLYVNNAMRQLYHMDTLEILGTAIYNFAMPPAATVREHIAQIIKTGEQCRGELTVQTPSGNPLYFEYIYAPVFDDKGKVEAIAGSSRDISERKCTEEKIWQSANYDPLTELANRRLFHEKLDETIKHSKRSGNIFSLLYIDLDQFKTVNDTLGHNIGDLLLKQTAKRIKGCTREIDTISRIGGDEFTVILEDTGDMKDVVLVTKKILSSLHKPFLIKNHKINISASIGIALNPQDGVQPDTLIKNADQAMYAAKKNGGNQFILYSNEANK